MFTDFKLEQMIGALLRAGVLVSALVVFIGGVLYLHQHGGARPDYHNFHGAPEELRSVPGVVKAASTFDSRGIIQFGLLLLVLTPIARVVFSAVGFLLERDSLYVAITALVLAVLLYSLLKLQ